MTTTHQEGGSFKQKDFVSIEDCGKVAQTGLQVVDIGDE